MIFDGGFFFGRKVLCFAEGDIQVEVIDRSGSFGGNVVKEEVIGRDMEGLAEVGEGGKGGKAFSGFPLGDVDVGNTDFFGKLGLSQAAFFPESAQFFCEIHGGSDYIAKSYAIQTITIGIYLTNINLKYIVYII